MRRGSIGTISTPCGRTEGSTVVPSRTLVTSPDPPLDGHRQPICLPSNRVAVGRQILNARCERYSGKGNQQIVANPPKGKPSYLKKYRMMISSAKGDRVSDRASPGRSVRLANGAMFRNQKDFALFRKRTKKNVTKQTVENKRP